MTALLIFAILALLLITGMPVVSAIPSQITSAWLYPLSFSLSAYNGKATKPCNPSNRLLCFSVSPMMLPRYWPIEVLALYFN